jgi:hypothetical protein
MLSLRNIGLGLSTAISLYALYRIFVLQGLHLATNDVTAYQPLLEKSAIGLIVAASATTVIWVFGKKLRWVAFGFTVALLFFAYDWISRYEYVFR